MSSSNSSSDLSEEKLKDQQRLMPASRRCPSCNHELDCNPDMVGFPAGVKFDPSDQELIEHLESMVKDGSRAHPLIGNFIRTLQGNDGICYTLPENLPGVTRDGVSKHFFHRSSKAYTSGTRKRRKIQSERGLRSCDVVGEARWHKTGKTRPVIIGGQQKGCKKILVLYSNYGKPGKPGKTNWVMHQYHLGAEEEKDGDLVVSKVFYQQTMRSTATIMEQSDEKVEVTSEAMKDMLPGCGAEETAVAADTMMQMRQHHQQNQADGHSRFTSAKRSHEAGVGDPLAGDQGQLHETHHIPSPHKVRSVLTKPVKNTMSFVQSTSSLNTESTKVSPAVQYPALLNNGEKRQEDQQKKKKVDRRLRLCSSEEAMIASQTTSTEEDDVQEASTQPKELQRPYQHWPPDHHQVMNQS